jgi:copper(I)-binding protein
VKFEPVGRHVILSGLKQPLVAGTHIPVTLHFQHAGDVIVHVEVVPATASGPGAAAGAMP